MTEQELRELIARHESDRVELTVSTTNTDKFAEPCFGADLLDFACELRRFMDQKLFGFALCDRVTHAHLGAPGITNRAITDGWNTCRISIGVETRPLESGDHLDGVPRHIHLLPPSACSRCPELAPTWYMRIAALAPAAKSVGPVAEC